MRLVLATRNPGKLAELTRLLAPYAVELSSAEELELGPVAETGDSYLANARLKALAVARAAGELSLADDAGLAVDALGGEPGLHTAGYTDRVGGVAAACADLAARTGLRDPGAPEVRAALHCALVLADRHGVRAEAVAEVRGRLRWPPGCEPGLAAIFVPDPPIRLCQDQVLAHRRLAFEQIVAALRDTRADRD
jgi:XTP/dITP diphosphohydrolase